MGATSTYLSVVIPAYNEEKRIAATLEALAVEIPRPYHPYEVIVVNDGSGDRTAAVVERLQRTMPHLSLINLERNCGKGRAVTVGMLAAEGTYTVFMDADLSTPLTELPRIMAGLEAGWDVAIGSRALPESVIEIHQPLFREWMGKIFNRFVRWLVIPHILDTQCGFKGFRREAARAIFSRLATTRFGFDVEVLLWAQHLGLGMREVPIRWRNAPHSRVSPITDSWEMFWTLIRLKQSFQRRIRECPKPYPPLELVGK